MRVTSDLYAAALVRRVFADGGFAAIERSGAREAGAIFVKARHRDGRETLYGPAPQALVDDAGESGRIFEVRCAEEESETIAHIIAGEARFDSDLWLIEIETDSPEAYLEIVDV